MQVDIGSTRSSAQALSRERRSRLTAQLFAEAHEATDEKARSAALRRVTEVNMCVAEAIASRYRGRGIAREDLEQVAYLALVKAVRGFDVLRGGDFLSYATPTITGELKKHFRDHGWTIRPPRRVQELQLQVIHERVRIRESSGKSPTVAELAARLGESPEVVHEALLVDGCFTPTSLDAPVRGDGFAVLGDTLVDDNDHAQEAAEARVILQPAVRGLGLRDRRILRMRFIDGCTQQEIADELGVTQMQVSRLLSRIVRDLRHSLVAPPSDLDPDDSAPPLSSAHG